MLQDLRELEPKHWLTAVATGLAVVAPGFLCIYLYKPALFARLDVVKLLVWSSSLTLPFATVNFLLLGAAMEEVERDFPLAGAWALSAVVTSFVLYGALALAYVQQVPFRTFAQTVLFFESLAGLLFGVVFLFGKVKSRKKK